MHSDSDSDGHDVSVQDDGTRRRDRVTKKGEHMSSTDVGESASTLLKKMRRCIFGESGVGSDMVLHLRQHVPERVMKQLRDSLDALREGDLFRGTRNETRHL